MEITKLALHNIKSYRDAEIEFAKGTNAISGENGAGKTTILQAIGFALFDSVDINQNDLIRHGERAGTIEVWFIANDEREYKVTRKVGKSEYFVYDPRTKEKLAVGKEDVVEWIKEHLGIARERDLKMLFSQAIGVPQGLIVAPFIDIPSMRKATFDRILEVNEYSEANVYMRGTESLVKDRIADADAKIAEMKGRIADFDEVKARKDALDNDIAALKEQLSSITAEHEKCLSERDKMDALSAKKKELEMSLREIERELREKESRLKDLKEMLAQSQNARKIVESTKPAFEEYVALEKESEEANRALQAMQKAERELASVEKELISIETEQKGHLEALERINDAMRMMEALKADVEKQDAIEAKVRELEKNAAVARNLKEALAKETQELENARKLISELEACTQGLEALESEVAKIEFLEKERDRYSDAIAEGKADITKIMESKAKMKDGICPILETKCPSVGADVDAYFASKVAEMQKQNADLVKEQKKIKRELEKCKEARESLEKKNREIVKLNMMREREKALGERLAADSEKARELERISNELPGERQALESLGNPKEEYDKLWGVASRHDEVKERIEKCENRKKKCVSKKDDLVKSLDSLKEAQERVDRIRQRTSELRDAYGKYQRHVGDSDRLDERAFAVAKVEDEISASRNETSKLNIELSELKKGFSDEEYAKVRARCEELSSARAGAEARLMELVRSHGELTERLAKLEEVRATIEEENKKLESNRRLLELVVYLRKLINDASPLITEAYMKRICFDANKLYRTLSGNEACELVWDKNYDITVRERGKTTHFKQLSGGQQMAAALSARLALLKNISEVSIAFFDEPTQNLDRERRENLARALSSISGFTQLFVISHDDTFDQNVDNMIMLGLVDGETQVVSEGEENKVTHF